MMPIFTRFNQKGFTLVEVMVVAGMVAGLSLAIMQMTKNANQVVKKMTQDTEVLQLTSDIQFSMRDKAKCNGTFATRIVTDATSAAGSPVQTVEGTSVSTGIIKNITPSLTIARIGQEYATGTPGAFYISDLRLRCPRGGCAWTAVTPAALNESTGMARIMVYITKGHLNSSAAIQSNISLGSNTYVREVVLSKVTVDTTTNAIKDCYTDEDFYADAACTSLNGRMDTDGFCKGIDIGTWGTTVTSTSHAATFQGGNVGIGTTNPVNKLDIAGAVALGTYGSASIAAPSMGLIVSGNVGIGTTTPTATLEVNGDIKVVTQAGVVDRFFRAEEVGAVGNKAGIAFGASAVKGAIYGSSGTSGIKIVGANSPIDLGTTSGIDATDIAAFTSRLFITAAGSVGIGTTVPLSLLHSNGNLTVGSGATAGSPGNVQLTVGGASPINNRLTYGTDGTGWKFAISKNQAGTVTDQVVVQDNGRVGIGTPTPSELLTVYGGHIDTDQTADNIGALSATPGSVQTDRRFVTKEWVYRAMIGSGTAGFDETQKDAIMSYLLDYLFTTTGTAANYTQMRAAIATYTLGLINVNGAASGVASDCGANSVVKGLTYTSSGTFAKTCVADNRCAATGDCASVYAGGSVFATTNFCYGTTGAAGTCMTNGVARVRSCAMVVRNVYLTSASTSGDDWICPSSKVMAGIRLGAIDDISTMTVLCCSVQAVNN